MRANVRSYHNGVATLTNKNVSSVVVLNLKPALAASLAITHNNNLKTKPNRCYCCSIRLNERSIVSFRLVSFINETFCMDFIISHRNAINLISRHLNVCHLSTVYRFGFTNLSG